MSDDANLHPHHEPWQARGADRFILGLLATLGRMVGPMGRSAVISQVTQVAFPTLFSQASAFFVIFDKTDLPLMDQILRTIHPPRYREFDDDFFFALCQANETMALERDANGNIILMPPTGSETGRYNADISGEIWSWNRRTKLGYVFDSSTGFKLPNSAVRSPDVAWISRERWEAVSETDRQGFAPLCPDFVIEIRSKSDDLKELKEKMEEYRDNGCRLGWLIDRAGKQVFIYRENGSIEIKKDPGIHLTGEEMLPELSIQIEW